MDALLLGAATAYRVRQTGAWEVLCQRRKQLWTLMEGLTVMSAVLLVPSATSGISPTLLMQVVVYDCLDVLYVCLLLACLVDEKLARVQQEKWLMGLGAIAYGAYLPNVPVFRVVEILVPATAGLRVAKALLVLAVTLVLAKASWGWFEKPLVRLGYRAKYE